MAWRGDISRLQIAGWMDYRVDDGTGTFGLQNRLNKKKSQVRIRIIIFFSMYCHVRVRCAQGIEEHLQENNIRWEFSHHDDNVREKRVGQQAR